MSKLQLIPKKDIFFLCSILLILLGMNYRTLDTWFIIDDTGNIFCSGFDTFKLLFDRGTYLYLNQLFFTPLLPVSFKIDWLLFKMNPTGYHIHNLVAAFLGCTAFYAILRSYFPCSVAWLGTAFFSVSLPVSFDIGWITRKHYLWGFLLSLVAIYLFKGWEEKKGKILLFLSLLSSLSAFLFKEAYAILPAVMFFIASGAIKERAKKALPYFFVLAVYLFWRMYMLGSMGGYPGTAAKSFAYFIDKLFHIPMDLSGSLFGFSLFPLLLLVVIAFLSIRMLFFFVIMLIIVVSPFIFFPGGGFLLANKALAFVAVISFAMSYVAYSLSSRHKGLLIIFVLLLIPVIAGSVSKTIGGQDVIIQLSRNYEMASREIIGDKDKKILIVGNYAYYFSNLEDIYRNMLGTDFPRIKSISDPVALSFVQADDFDKVISFNNLDLDPDSASRSSVDVMVDEEAEKFVRSKTEEYAEKMVLPPPLVNFALEKDYLRIQISDSREGTYLRCLSMGSYVGCYPIPRNYIFKLNRVKKIDRMDIIYVPGDGPISPPSSIIHE